MSDRPLGSMNGSPLWIFAVVAGVAIGTVLVVSTVELGSFWSDHDELAGVAQTFSESMADALVESGFRAEGLDPDDPLLDERKIVISEAMNASVALRVMETLLLLDARDPRSPIDLYISTNGGWYDSAFAIADTIRMIDAPVNTIAVGGCYSAGALILVAGTGTRSATAGTVLSVHANIGHSDTPYEYERYNEARMEGFFRRFASLPESWYPLSGDPEHYYFDPETAKRIGMIDSILEH